ncbi:MAG: hypothetical protein QOJ44_437 [Acidimicrobiaceae bacterium]|nr:hypothetical protein [Acidimicrobiaceae bacterium]
MPILNRGLGSRTSAVPLKRGSANVASTRLENGDRPTGRKHDLESVERMGSELDVGSVTHQLHVYIGGVGEESRAQRLQYGLLDHPVTKEGQHSVSRSHVAKCGLLGGQHNHSPQISHVYRGIHSFDIDTHRPVAPFEDRDQTPGVGNAVDDVSRIWGMGDEWATGLLAAKNQLMGRNTSAPGNGRPGQPP